MAPPFDHTMLPWIYTYIVRGRDERSSHLDLRPMTHLEDPMEHAHKLLREHQSCDQVEIWNDEAFIAVVSRSTTVTG